MMKDSRISIGAAILIAGSFTFAEPFGAPADAKHAWSVHDDYRPGVKKIVSDGVKPPSDAIVLFDGTAKSIAANWCDNKGRPTKWALDPKGELISVRGAGYIFTKRGFGDCQLHVEWAAPKQVKGFGQRRGNSGVFLMGEYEIQVLDSYETDPDKKPNPNPNYPDGQAGAAYGQNPPSVNPCRAPGVFNTYDIIFHAPRFNADGSLKRPADITVLFNGVLVQDRWRLDGPTQYRRRASYDRASRAAKRPIALQDHGNPVHYRNIWVREIPNPDDNVTHGANYANEKDVLELRARTADKVEAEFEAKFANAKPGRKLLETWRIAAYFATPERLARVAKAEKEFLAASDGLAKKDMGDKLGIGQGELSGYYGDLLKLKLIDGSNAVLNRLRTMK